MKTITLFDICREYSIPTVQYSANPETLERWAGKNMVAVHDGYAYVEPNLPEHWVEFQEGNVLFSDLPLHQVDMNLLHLGTILFTEFDMKHVKIFFFDDSQQSYVSGFE